MKNISRLSTIRIMQNRIINQLALKYLQKEIELLLRRKSQREIKKKTLLKINNPRTMDRSILK